MELTRVFDVDKAYVLIKKVCRNAREEDDETSDDEGD